MVVPIQVPSIIMPATWVNTLLGTEVENINDLLEHTSIECAVEFLQEKQVQVMVTEFITAAMPGNLWLWIELSPYLTTTSGAYWAAIGGGGGAIAPFAPTILVPTGVLGTVHTVILPWAMHSVYARLVVQTPVAATPLTDFWVVQATVQAKG